MNILVREISSKDWFWTFYLVYTCISLWSWIFSLCLLSMLEKFHPRASHFFLFFLFFHFHGQNHLKAIWISPEIMWGITLYCYSKSQLVNGFILCSSIYLCDCMVGWQKFNCKISSFCLFLQSSLIKKFPTDQTDGRFLEFINTLLT